MILRILLSFLKNNIFFVKLHTQLCKIKFYKNYIISTIILNIANDIISDFQFLKEVNTPILLII